MSDTCQSSTQTAGVPHGTRFSMKCGGGQSCWLVASPQSNPNTDYSAVTVELWGHYGGGAALLRRQRMPTLLEPGTVVVRWSGGWFFTYEARIINEADEPAGPGALDAPVTAWALHSWREPVSANEPCGHTQSRTSAVDILSASAVRLLPADPRRRRTLVQYLAANAGDYIVIAESEDNATAARGFPVVGSVPAGASFAGATIELLNTNAVWARAVTAAPSISVRTFEELES